MNYIIRSPYLPDGKYLTSKKRWHERLRLKVASWILSSISYTERMEIKTSTGDACSYVIDLTSFWGKE